jgi:SagB-type dehydrogenase family enzyme
LRPPRRKQEQKPAGAVLSVKLNERVTIGAQVGGHLAAEVDGYAIELGQFSAQALRRAASLRTGLPLKSFASTSKPLDREMATLVGRLARRGLVEYRLARANRDLVVIEPQAADYWPQLAKLRARDTIVLSRFAYLRRRANAFVLESPRAAALFRICDPAVSSLLATLSTPQTIAHLKQQRAFPGLELLALLADCQILFTLDADKGNDGLRPSEGDQSLLLWDFHDLLFHTRSTEGRQANPLGGLYRYADIMPPLPAERPSWPGATIELSRFGGPPASAFESLLHERRSVRDFDDKNPITLGELAQFLYRSARVLARWESPLDFEGRGPVVAYTSRPYPSAGSAYPLELYLAVANCAELPRGFYHYDSISHALTAITVASPQLESMLGTAQFAMDAATSPQVLITIAARFGRLSWKYAAIAYSLVLKDVGALLQTFYLTATDIGLGGCAVGISNIELFAKMTGVPFHVEGPVGQFVLGRGAKPENPD